MQLYQMENEQKTRERGKTNWIARLTNQLLPLGPIRSQLVSPSFQKGSYKRKKEVVHRATQVNEMQLK